MVKIKGLNKLNNKLKKIENNAKKLNSKGKVTFDELFNFEFMNTNTNFDNINDFFKYSNIEVTNQIEFELLEEYILDEAVLKATCFNSWQEMIDEAGLKYMKKKLFDGVKL